MPKKKTYQYGDYGEIAGAYYDNQGRLRLIAQKTSGGRPVKTGLPIRTRRVSNIAQERAKIDVVERGPARRLPIGQLTRQELRDIHAARSEISRVTDDELFAVPAKTQEEWLAQMNRRDIRGIDEFPMEVHQDFRRYYPEYVDSFEKYHESSVHPHTIYHVHKTHASFDRKYGKKRASSKGVLGFARNHEDGSGEIHMGPRTANLIAQGHINKAEDFIAWETTFHELGHRMGPSGHPLYGHDYVGKSGMFYRTGFDEGANEILAFRFVINNVRMPGHVRRRLTGTKTFDERYYEQASTYQRQQKMAAKAALIAGRGDEKKAIQWLEDMRYAKDVKTAEKAQKQFADEVLKARKESEGNPKIGPLKRKILPDTREKAETLLKWQADHRYEGTIDTVFSNVLEAKGIKDPYRDPPKKYQYNERTYEYEMVKVKGKWTHRKTGKYQDSTQALPWWLIV